MGISWRSVAMNGYVTFSLLQSSKRRKCCELLQNKEALLQNKEAMLQKEQEIDLVSQFGWRL